MVTRRQYGIREYGIGGPRRRRAACDDGLLRLETERYERGRRSSTAEAFASGKSSHGPLAGLRRVGAERTHVGCAQLFTAHSDELEMSEDGRVVTRCGQTDGSSSTALKDGRKLGGGGRSGTGSRYRCAMCSYAPDVMHKGMHLAEFELVRAAGNIQIGVAQVNYDPAKVCAPGEPRGDAGESWGMSTKSGSLTFRGQTKPWKGRQPPQEGDRIGMLVDLASGSITVFLNRKRLGTMLQSGLGGPLCWTAELAQSGDSVRIRRFAPLPDWAKTVK